MAPPTGYGLVFSDEFDGTSLDTSKWIRWIGPASHSTVSNGKLQLLASPIGDFSNGSSFIYTKTQFKYGYFEFSVQALEHYSADTGIWLNNCSSGSCNTKPEIDILERPGGTGGICCFSVMDDNGNWSSSGLNNKYPQTNTGYHKYALLWTPTNVTYYIDDVQTWTHNASNVTKAMNLSLEVCTGCCTIQGQSFCSSSDNGSSASAFFEYARVYQQGAVQQCNDPTIQFNLN